MLLHIKLI